MRRALLLAAAVLSLGTGCGAAGSGAGSDPSSAAVDLAAVTTAPTGGHVVLPPADARWSYQLGGGYAPPAGVQVVDRDRTDAPAAGLYSVCYVNAFQAQPEDVASWRAQHDDLLLHDAKGEEVVDTGWDETLFDVSTAAKRQQLAAVEDGWIDGCKAKGFQAVEPDNLDSYTRSKGLLTADDALAFARLLIARAHADGLAIAQKNAADLAARNPGFDFAVAEECHAYDECSSYTDVYGSHVLEVEYADGPFGKACAAGDPRVERRDRDLAPAGAKGHVETWC